MTYNELYRHIISLLKKAGIDSPAFDTLCLFENKLGFDRHKLIMQGNTDVSEQQKEIIIKLAQKRAEGYPLQYLLGIWEFMDCKFFVGEGVLIPREDTSVVVNLCADNLKNISSAKILDLCAGSGAISIVLSKIITDSTVTALELSDNAIEYLLKNVQHNACDNVNVVKGDVFNDYIKFKPESFDAVISNPPYIIRDEIKTLQKEVQYEPVMALDGGKDGYDFYKAIIENWSRCIKPGGILTLELGENQYDTVKLIMKKKGFTNITYALDLGNIKRGICGVKATSEITG